MIPPEWLQRLMWKRTRAESVEMSQWEAVERERRAAADEGRCFLAHAPEIWGAYCETHKWPVYSGHTCDLNKEQP